MARVDARCFCRRRPPARCGSSAPSRVFCSSWSGSFWGRRLTLQVDQIPGDHRTLICRQAVPLHSFGIVFWHAFATGVYQAEIGLRIGISLISRLAIPLQGFSSILRHAFAVGVTPAEVVLRIDIALFRRLPIPLHGFDLILRHADAVCRYIQPRLNCAAASPCSAFFPRLRQIRREDRAH